MNYMESYGLHTRCHSIVSHDVVPNERTLAWTVEHTGLIHLKSWGRTRGRLLSFQWPASTVAMPLEVPASCQPFPGSTPWHLRCVEGVWPRGWDLEVQTRAALVHGKVRKKPLVFPSKSDFILNQIWDGTAEWLRTQNRLDFHESIEFNRSIVLWEVTNLHWSSSVYQGVSSITADHAM